jgi:hypothetical protein
VSTGAQPRSAVLMTEKTDFVSEEERLAQRHYIALALSGKRRKVPSRFRPKRRRTPHPLVWR